MAKRPTNKNLVVGSIVKRETKSNTGKMARYYEIVAEDLENETITLQNIEDGKSKNVYKKASVRRLFYAIDEKDEEIIELRKEKKEEVEEDKKKATQKPKIKAKAKGPAVTKKPARKQKNQKDSTKKSKAEVTKERSERAKNRNSKIRQQALYLKTVLINQILADAAFKGTESYETTQYDGFKRSGGYAYAAISTSSKGRVRISMRGEHLDESTLTEEEISQLVRLPKKYGHSLNTQFMLETEKDIPLALKFLEISFRSAIK